MGDLRNSKDIYVDYKKPLTIVKIIFLCWGFITVVNGPLLEELGKGANFSKEQSGMLGHVFFAAYFFFGIFGAMLINKFGFKKTLMYGLGVAAISVFFLVSGARASDFNLVFAGVVIQAAGFSILQVTANPYVILIGKPEEGGSRLSGAGAFNSFGTWLAPLMGSLIAASGVSSEVLSAVDQAAMHVYKTELVVLPYVLITVVFVGMIVLVNFSDIPAIDQIQNVDTNVKGSENKKYVLQYKHVVLGFFAIFFYVGAEVSIASKLYEFLKSHIEDESLFASINYIIPYYWGGAMVGRFVGAEILKDSKTNKVLFVACVLAAAVLGMAIITPTQGALFMILGVGLFNSVMWPTIFELGVHGMGRFTAYASSVLIMGIVGGAAVPMVVNALIDSGQSLNVALCVPLVCYAYIAFYALSGSKYQMKEEY